MKRTRQTTSITKFLVWLVDFLLFSLAMLLAYELRFILIRALYDLGLDYLLNIPVLHIPRSVTLYIKGALLYGVIMTFISFHFRSYDLNSRFSKLDEFANITKISLTGLFITIGIWLFFRWFDISRFVFLWSAIFTIILVGIWRILLNSLFNLLWKRGYNLGNIIIYGAGKAGQLLASEILLFSPFGQALVGFIDDDPHDKTKGITILEGKRISYLGKGEELIEQCDKYDVSQVFIAMPTIDHDKLLYLISLLRENRINFYIMPDFFEMLSFRVNPYQIGSITLYSLPSHRLTRYFRLLKRAGDLAISLFVIAITLPLWLIIACAIKFDTSGPVFFRQERVGEGNRVFRIFKFRSMFVGAEKMNAVAAKKQKKEQVIQKLKDDPRVTRVGRFLRHTSLDELPQILNVFLGNMSLVGPRPLMPAEVKKFKPWHYRRLQVPQGITGLVQVSGRSDLSFDEMVKLDLFYVENWSFWLDLKIFLRTIPSVLFMKGAY
jgi:exopolysaccharide biosynthesis polyprenyl glycosylphosphotransferase